MKSYKRFYRFTFNDLAEAIQSCDFIRNSYASLKICSFAKKAEGENYTAEFKVIGDFENEKDFRASLKRDYMMEEE